MELDLESMTETYVLSLEESQFYSCLLSTCDSLRSSVRDTLSQTELKAWKFFGPKKGRNFAI